ncbi:unnamed protein product [Phytophthora fragariaefolia]|uniref:Unnamed protein product n=1 Tax=Phytophthora fragariaefolia TaxID=1490495 RepID=A0A9W7D720_9STRA|nr:unnamed protein product [Phytophthora fragariaefolia]
MSDSTQLADQFLLQSSLKPDTSVKLSRGKSVAVVIDGQSGSYSSGIVSFDCASALNGSQGYASLKDASLLLQRVSIDILSLGDEEGEHLLIDFILGRS